MDNILKKKVFDSDFYKTRRFLFEQKFRKLQRISYILNKNKVK